MFQVSSRTHDFFFSLHLRQVSWAGLAEARETEQITHELQLPFPLSEPHTVHWLTESDTKLLPAGQAVRASSGESTLVRASVTPKPNTVKPHFEHARALA